MSIAHPHAVAAVSAAIVGLATGSFAGVLADRIPRGESVLRPPSHCTACDTPLRAVDNIPIVSYLILRGRCRNCGVRIPPRDVLVELVTAGLFAAVAWRVPTFWAIPAYCVLAAGLVALSVVDLEHKRLPTAIVYGTALLGAPLLVGATALSHRWSHLLVAVIGAAACFAVFFAIWFLVPKGMGFGDVRLAALCGGWLGWLGAGVIPVGILAGFVLAGLPAIALLAVRKANRKTQLAFGPFLAAGTMVGVLAGIPIAHFWAHP
jgi:leader peptidase (prepilin peptidase)/N-methyltransferase